MATKKYKFGEGNSGAKAIHSDLPDGKHQFVGIGGMRVFIMPDGNFWFAKGLEIDYATQGSTLEEAKDNFSKGLAETIDLHLQIHGNIENLLVPSDILQVLAAARAKGVSVHEYEQVSVHDIGIQSRVDFLFDTIDYFRVEKAA